MDKATLIKPQIQFNENFQQSLFTLIEGGYKKQKEIRSNCKNILNASIEENF
jgi:hypothetical protein